MYVSESSRNRLQWSELKTDAETLTQKKIPIHSVSGSAPMPTSLADCSVQSRSVRPLRRALHLDQYKIFVYFTALVNKLIII